jgi:pimeloyl-ACP methyl ester carboxylesterase
MTEHSDSFAFVRVLRDGRTISFCEYGKPNRAAVFLFHGTPGSRIFGLDDKEVSDAGFHIITPERPGYGRSTPNLTASISGWAFDIRELADQLGLKRFHVVGISGGGPFALACAARLPDRVISATLISSATPIDFPGFWKGMSIWNKFVFLLASRLPFALRSVCAIYASAHNVWNRNTYLRHDGEAFRQGGIGFETDLRLASGSWGVPFDSISVPVFLWHGEEDPLASVAGAKTLASAIPTCEAHFIPGKGHFLNRDATVGQQIFDRILSIPVANIAVEQDAPQAALPLGTRSSP